MMVCVNLHEKTLVSHLYKLFDSQVFRRFDDYSNDYSSCNESKSKHSHTQAHGSRLTTQLLIPELCFHFPYVYAENWTWLSLK